MSTTAARRMGSPTTKDITGKGLATSEGDAADAQRSRETAQYISDMILELRNMAKAAKLFQIMVPLEYAYYEAFSVANRVDVPPQEAERLREFDRAASGADGSGDDY